MVHINDLKSVVAILLVNVLLRSQAPGEPRENMKQTVQTTSTKFVFLAIAMCLQWFVFAVFERVANKRDSNGQLFLRV